MVYDNLDESLNFWLGWSIYHVVVLFLIALDLFIWKKERKLIFKSALILTIMWIGVGLSFGVLIFLFSRT